jgi:hypothetical protein
MLPRNVQTTPTELPFHTSKEVTQQTGYAGLREPIEVTDKVYVRAAFPRKS